MKKFATIAILACIAVACAEPPAPQSQYLPPPNNYLPPHKGPQPTYMSPQSTYMSPQSTYNAPQPSYGPPQQNYGPPQSTYGPPQPTYGTPPQSYGPPQSTYGAPGPKHGGDQGYSNGGQGGNSGYGKDDDSYGPAKYEFKYDVQDFESGNDFGHMESRDGDRATGRYYVLLPDGRKQVVDYEADQNGYRPTISYEKVGGYDNNGQPSFKGYN